MAASLIRGRKGKADLGNIALLSSSTKKNFPIKNSGSISIKYDRFLLLLFAMLIVTQVEILVLMGTHVLT